MVDPSCANLATKAELQELRDQLNAIFGKSASGVKDIFAQGSLEGTSIQASLGYADTAMQDISTPLGDDNEILTAIAVGSAVFQKQIGSGTKVVLNGMGKAFTGVGKAAKAVPAMLSGLKINAEVSSLTLALVSQAFQTYFTVKTLDLIKMNQENNDAQFNAYNRDFTNLIHLLGKANGDIAEANRINAEQKQTITEQRQANEIQAQQIAVANTDISSLVDTNRKQNETIRNNRAAFDAFKTEVAEVQQANVEAFDELSAYVELIETQLTEAETLINDQNAKIEALQTQVAELEAKSAKQQEQIDALQTFAFATDRRLFYLELGIQQALDGVDEQLDDFEGELARIAVVAGKKTRGGGTSLSGTHTAIANFQNKFLDFLSRTAGLGNYSNTITDSSVRDNTDEFDSEYERVTSYAGGTGAVNRDELNDWGDTFKDTVTTTVLGGIATNWGQTFTDIKSQTAPASIAAAAATGACEAGKPGGCLQTNLTNPINQKVDQLINAAGTAFSAANNVILQQMQPVLNTVKATTDTIKGVVNATHGVVTHAKHGLEAVQKFGEKAWQATHADKILNAITTAIVIHNGIQLSQNLLVTLGETATVVLQAIGVKDSNNEDIDVNAWFQVKMRSWMESILGTENYAALTTRIAKYNRIYQAGANILDASRELFDSARSTAELTAENTGKIGNALLRSGVVSEDSYTTMIDKVYPHSKAMRRLERFRNGLEEVEDSVSTVGNIASEVVSTKDAFTELKEAKEEWKTANDALVTEKDTATNETKEESTVVDGIKNTDFDREETEE